MQAARIWTKLLLLAALLPGAAGCAREAGEPRSPTGPAAAGWVLPPGQYAWPPKTLRKSGEKPPVAARGTGAPVETAQAPVLSPLRFAAGPGVPTYADGRPRPLAPELVATEIPPAEACIQQLRGAGVRFEQLQDKRGVDTPVAILGPLGAVRYWTLGPEPMVADCRLALALAKVAPELKALGITSVRFSGAYSYRMARVGRLSLHAYGLALDIHEVTADGRSYSVRRDFARGLPNGCAEDAPLPNRLACRLSRVRLFQELLTPDSNADHHDHLHLALARAPRD